MQLPNILLRDECGEEVYFQDLIRDHTVVLNMFYSRCERKCQPLGRLLARVNLLLGEQLRRGERIRFVSITLDGDRDDPEQLAAFKAQVWRAGCRNWRFYTGKPEEIEALRRQLGMYSPEPEIDAVMSNHSGNFLVFNPTTGGVKHTQAFDNPIDIARKVVQLETRNFYAHSYNLDALDYAALSPAELFDNVHSINAMFTVPFLPIEQQTEYARQAERQRGFQYEPPIATATPACCCQPTTP